MSEEYANLGFETAKEIDDRLSDAQVEEEESKRFLESFGDER
jgi:hypothetical protein